MSVGGAENRDQTAAPTSGKSPSAFRTITEVASELDLPQHVLRFWETKFPQIRPLKRRGGRRYYRPEDVVLLREVRRLLYVDGYTIRGVQKLLRQKGRRALEQAPRPPAGPAPGSAATGEMGAEEDRPGTTTADGPAAEQTGDAPPAQVINSTADSTGISAPLPYTPKWRRDMEMSTVLRKELLTLLEELEEVRALLPANIGKRGD